MSKSKTPDYYLVRLPNYSFVSLHELIDGSYTHRQCEAIEHIMRAGRKPGESYIKALKAARRSLDMEIERVERDGKFGKFSNK